MDADNAKRSGHPFEVETSEITKEVLNDILGNRKVKLVVVAKSTKDIQSRCVHCQSYGHKQLFP